MQNSLLSRQSARSERMRITVELYRGPMNLARFGGVLQHRLQQITHCFQSGLPGTPGSGARNQSINSTPIETFHPKPNHPITAKKEFADRLSGNTHQQRVQRRQTNVPPFGRRGFHRHPEFLRGGVFCVRMQLSRTQRSVSTIFQGKVQVLN